MCNLKNLVLLAAIILLPSGCAKYWYQEGKTFDECQQARAQCFEELKKRTDFSNPSAEYEIQFMTECMQSKGYRTVSADELPLDVRREEPQSSLHWRTKGIAGTLTDK
jgi:PBP1b-binding outer membrane lipoprotein LpoB